MTEATITMAIDHAAAEAQRNGLVKNDAARLYGPTIADQRDRARCECGHFIGYGACYVYDIGGGVALACPSCTLKSVSDGSAVLLDDDTQSAQGGTR